MRKRIGAHAAPGDDSPPSSSWGRRRGSLGLTLWVQPLRRRLGSLSAGESEADLARWLASDDHRQVVRGFKGRMRNVSSDPWTTQDFAVHEACQEAGRRRAKPAASHPTADQAK